MENLMHVKKGQASETTIQEHKMHLCNKEWVQVCLTRAFPQGYCLVEDTRGDDMHLTVNIVHTSFQGMSLVQRHRAVYSALDALRQGRIHALSISAKAPDESS